MEDTAMRESPHTNDPIAALNKKAAKAARLRAIESASRSTNQPESRISNDDETPARTATRAKHLDSDLQPAKSFGDDFAVGIDGFDDTNTGTASEEKSGAEKSGSTTSKGNQPPPKTETPVMVEKSSQRKGMHNTTGVFMSAFYGVGEATAREAGRHYLPHTGIVHLAESPKPDQIIGADEKALAAKANRQTLDRFKKTTDCFNEPNTPEFAYLSDGYGQAMGWTVISGGFYDDDRKSQQWLKEKDREAFRENRDFWHKKDLIRNGTRILMALIALTAYFTENTEVSTLLSTFGTTESTGFNGLGAGTTGLIHYMVSGIFGVMAILMILFWSKPSADKRDDRCLTEQTKRHTDYRTAQNRAWFLEYCRFLITGSSIHETHFGEPDPTVPDMIAATANLLGLSTPDSLNS